MEAFDSAILDEDDVYVDFIPDPEQLRPKALKRPIARWQIAVPVFALVLLMIGWLAYRPGVAVAHGAVSLAQPAEAAHKFELFQLPEWHDEPPPAPMQTADIR